MAWLAAADVDSGVRLPQHKQMRKLAAIYERKGALFVTAAHRTIAGFWIDDERVDTLDRPVPEDLGRAVEAALARSQDGVATPPPTARPDKPLLRAAGVSSWATFMKLSKHISVSLDGDVLNITPYRNLGGKEGFEPQPYVAVALPASASTLGTKLIEMLNEAE